MDEVIMTIDEKENAAGEDNGILEDSKIIMSLEDIPDDGELIL